MQRFKWNGGNMLLSICNATYSQGMWQLGLAVPINLCAVNIQRMIIIINDVKKQHTTTSNKVLS